jgi:dipeptidyl aminopeptidase/acylaminoacyl peptidase
MAFLLLGPESSRAGTEDIPQPMRFSLLDAPELRLHLDSTQPFAVSRDGWTFVFAARTDDGASLWMRTLDQTEPRRLADAANGYQPAISPDGQWLAFVVANHVIRKVRLRGGSATTIASIDDTTAALTWATDDLILFEKIGSESGIHQVSANGGAPELLIPLDPDEVEHRRPFVVRDRQIVFYASRTTDGRTTLAAFSLADRRRRRLEVEGIQALGVIDDHLIYARRDGAVLAVPLDFAELRVTGQARQLDERVYAGPVGTSVMLSEHGTLVSAPAELRGARVMSGDDAGRVVQASESVRHYRTLRFSPDGQRIAAAIVEREAADLWILHRQTGQATRVTRDGRASLMDWTADGKALIYVRENELRMALVDGSADPRRLVESNGRVLRVGPS